MNNSLKTWTFGVIIFTATFFCYAAQNPQIVLEIENDMNDNATRLIARQSRLFFMSENVDTRKTTTVPLDFGPNNDQSLTLFERGGREAILIEAVDFTMAVGGTVRIHYLSNGVRDTWHSIEITLERGEQGWTARYRDTEVARMRVQARRILGKVIGIQEISPI